jgi:hypothetical protein
MASRPTQKTGGNQKILLVGGAMRSGTTVIHRALCTAENTNPYITESWLIRDLMSSLRMRAPRFEIMGEDQFGTMGNLNELVKMTIQMYLRMVSVRHRDPDLLILKHPELSRYFLELAAMFPTMRFLAIIRDPRDVIVSMRKVRQKHIEDDSISPFARMKTIADLCGYWASHYAHLVRAEKRFGDRLQFLRYEDAMRDPKSMIAEVGGRLGARYDLDAIPNFDKKNAESATFKKELRDKDPFSSAFWSDLYTKSLSTERIGKFADVLKPEEIEEIQTRLKGLGERFQYW